MKQFEIRNLLRLMTFLKYKSLAMCINFLSLHWGLPGGTVVKDPPANVGDVTDPGSLPGLGSSSREEHSNSLLQNPIVRGALQATVHRVAKSQTCLKREHVRPHA